jgi:predicted transcriptional regulator
MDSLQIQFFNDKKMMKIFQTLLDTPKTSRQISYECNMPIATVYRKLKSLENKRLVKTSGTINNGIRNRLYQKYPNEKCQYE